jgi:putative transposase
MFPIAHKSYVVLSAPNRKVKAERKKKIAETLDVSTRQVERLLDQYNDEPLHETIWSHHSDKAQHRIGDYWPEYSGLLIY